MCICLLFEKNDFKLFKFLYSVKDNRFIFFVNIDNGIVL